ncbi:MAG: 1-acyl-sn-glycerol-3-phosphate acyltransferase [Chlorobiaceae bacterium]|nr:1-acyl-sn-glycerol-3-phosphate acyltransferase [Chlorobiaceae bacterium]
MKKIFDLWCRPLPYLSAGKAMLLRVLMLPNLFLLRVEGENNLKEHGRGPCIYAFNHNNAFESLFVPVMLIYLLGGRRVSFVIDWMYGRLPLVGWLMNQIDPVYVYYKRSSLPFLERNRPKGNTVAVSKQCLDRLAAGESIGIFPEGTRNADPVKLKKARPGVGYIALESNAPVIPAGIEFTSSRKRNKVPSVGRMVLRIGAPMRFESLKALEEAHPNDNRRSLNSRLAEAVSAEVMLAIARLSGKSYPYEELTKTDAISNQPVEVLCPL